MSDTDPLNVSYRPSPADRPLIALAGSCVGASVTTGAGGWTYWWLLLAAGLVLGVVWWFALVSDEAFYRRYERDRIAAIKARRQKPDG